ncbi:MAG: nickel pincer cofactor biosynthesis protein LarB [Candidatus Omnitrophota bacterium]
MNAAAIKKILSLVSTKKMSAHEAFAALRDLPYKDLGFAKLDSHRTLRRGFPEVIYCERKTQEQIRGIVNHIIGVKGPLLLTRASHACYQDLVKTYPQLSYNPLAKAIFVTRKKKSNRLPRSGYVVVMTAGTSDIPVAEEARVTLESAAIPVRVLYDVGVAGIHRLFDHRLILEKADVIIVAAGMEGALASVVSGLVSKPVIAVPTSVGYGASFKGITALLAMLNSCSPGVVVVNIDNGFGAGYFASLISRRQRARSDKKGAA